MKSLYYVKEQLKKILHNLIVREENILDDYHLQRIKFTITSLDFPDVFRDSADNTVLIIEKMILNKEYFNVNLHALSVDIIDLYTNIVQYITVQSASQFNRKT
ncbi:TPA: hypothetical protein MFG29_005057 [Klebsiella pneumoniae]|nr:hypothetical protein [Klebsiella pneumoniae]